MSGIQAFFHVLYSLQHYPGTCTAVRYVNTGPSTPSDPGSYVTVYGGNCAQAWILVLQHFASYFGFN